LRGASHFFESGLTDSQRDEAMFLLGFPQDLTAARSEACFGTNDALHCALTSNVNFFHAVSAPETRHAVPRRQELGVDRCDGSQQPRNAESESPTPGIAPILRKKANE
jgi:hypothetical protein